MESSQMKIGRDYLYREKRAPGSPHQRVKLLAKVGRACKIRVRFIDGPFPGLEEYVHCGRIIVPWSESKAFPRDEQRRRRLEEISLPQYSHVVAEAILTVFAATGDETGCVNGDGVLDGNAAALRRVAQRAGIKKPVEELGRESFVDRFGRLLLSFDGALTLAMAFAKAEPEKVLLLIENEEAELRAKGYEPGEHYYHESLLKQAPANALARQWAGFENEVEQLREEIVRLRMVVKRAADFLDSAGMGFEADRVRREMDGG